MQFRDGLYFNESGEMLSNLNVKYSFYVYVNVLITAVIKSQFREVAVSSLHIVKLCHRGTER